MGFSQYQVRSDLPSGATGSSLCTLSVSTTVVKRPEAVLRRHRMRLAEQLELAPWSPLSRWRGGGTGLK